MALLGLRGVIFTFLLLSFSKRFSTNCANATQSLPTNREKTGVLQQRQNDLNNWQNKSAVIIHRLPGLLTKHAGQPFTVKLLNHRGAKKKYGMKIKEVRGRFYPFVKFLSGIRKMASLECKYMKEKQGQRMRGLLPRMFSSMNIPTCKQGQNKIVFWKINSLLPNTLSIV